MADIQVRLASLDDVPIITHHRNRMCAAMGSGTPQSRTQMDIHFDIWLRKRLTEGSYLGWFACDGDTVAAGIGLWLIDWAPHFNGFAGRLPYLLNVYTEPYYRKEGLARCLVMEAIQYCRDEGYPKMRLHASVDGQHLYEQLGFKNTNEMQLMLGESS